MNKKTDVQVMLREAAVLTIITLVAGLLLGFVYELTKEPIRLQKEKKVREACMAVFPGNGMDFKEEEYTLSDELLEELKNNGVTIGTVYAAVDASGEKKGYVVQTTSSEGYGGKIVLYAGITVEGILNDISILQINETPGLGLQAGKVLVPQFHNKPATAFAYTKTGSQSDKEIDAISGATITTKAVTNAVNGATAAVREWMGGAK